MQRSNSLETTAALQQRHGRQTEITRTGLLSLQTLLRASVSLLSGKRGDASAAVHEC